MSAQPLAISFEHVRFVHADGAVALADLCLDIRAGEIFGLLGPNGAGKTSAFKVLTGLETPTAGRCLVNSRPVTSAERGIYRDVGYMLCHGLGDAMIEARTAELLSQLQIRDRRDKRLGASSKGRKQEVCIARVMVHDPSVLRSAPAEYPSAVEPGSIACRADSYFSTR